MPTSANAQISSAPPASALCDADKIDSETFFSGSKSITYQVFPELDEDFCKSVCGLLELPESGRSQTPNDSFCEKPVEHARPVIDAGVALPVRPKRKASASPETFIRRVRQNMGRYRKGWSKTPVGRAFCAKPEKLQELFFDLKKDGNTDRVTLDRLYDTLTQSIDVNRDGTPIIRRGMKLQMLHFAESGAPYASPCVIVSVNHRTKKFVVSVKQNGKQVIEEREWSVYGCFDLVLP